MSPWRPLTALAVVIVALGGTMVGTGYHSPKLGIDLAGGTSLTLTAKDSKGTPSAADMNTAVDIMRKRVNGYGVSEAEVTKQGSSTIQVDIPGNSKSSVLDQIGKTAKLYFRVVYNERANAAPAATTPTTSPSGTPTTAPSGTPTTKASGTPSASATTTKAATPSSSATTQHKAVSDALLAATPSGTPSASSGTATASPSASASGSTTPSASGTPSATPTTPTKAANGVTRQTAPDAGTTALYNTINCASPPVGSPYYDNAPPENYSVGCSVDGKVVYLLGPAEVNGTDLTGASARQTTTSAGIVTGAWEIDLTLKDPGKTQFGNITGQLAQNGGTFAVEVDGQVYSAATASQAIVDGNAMISGSTFTQQSANDLANILSYGALPISFDAGDVQQISASLGGNQLSAGLLAGAIGLALVVLYLIFYYKALSFVAVSSLVIAAILTYSIATLLGPGMGFRLSLAGVAGLVVAIGITADSFVVFFERIRDEVREGRTLRTAVEHGWSRARRTIIAADFVSFLAAAVLYLVSVGTVKGFAFTLGLTTLIDVFVVFMFTKPVMTLLARTRFYNSGRKWSGLDPSVLGARQNSGPRQTIADRRRAAADAEGMEA